jgi:hypothetical protein
LIDLVDWRRRVADVYRNVRLTKDSNLAWEGWKSAKNELFRSHPQSPIPEADRKSFKGLSYFGYDPAFRVIAELHEVEPVSMSIEGSVGQPFELTRFAAATFALQGAVRQLELYWFESYGGGLFLSFRDATSGRETYGGCRYLLDTVKGADLGGNQEGLVLDFNFAYQPSCAYDPSWSCPLAPPANRLDVPVRAGERR